MSSFTDSFSQETKCAAPSNASPWVTAHDILKLHIEQNPISNHLKAIHQYFKRNS